MADIAQEIWEILKEKMLTLAVVESATGGLISHLLTNVPGISEYYKGSVTAYSNEIKIKVVGVKEATIAEYGAVSSQVAEQMAEGGQKLLNADICIADTGIAGPGGATADKPVGLFYIGLSSRQGTFSLKHIFKGSREQNKAIAAETALLWLKQHLENTR